MDCITVAVTSSPMTDGFYDLELAYQRPIPNFVDKDLGDAQLASGKDTKLHCKACAKGRDGWRWVQFALSKTRPRSIPMAVDQKHCPNNT